MRSAGLEPTLAARDVSNRQVPTGELVTCTATLASCLSPVEAPTAPRTKLTACKDQRVNHCSKSAHIIVCRLQYLSSAMTTQSRFMGLLPYRLWHLPSKEGAIEDFFLKPFDHIARRNEGEPTEAPNLTSLLRCLFVTLRITGV